MGVAARKQTITLNSGAGGVRFYQDIGRNTNSLHDYERSKI